MHSNNNDIIEDTAKIVSVDGKKVSFQMINNGSCKSCSMNGVCGTNNNPITHQSITDLKVQVGDVVKVFLSAETKILSAFILFIIPILSMILFYLLGKLTLNLSEDFSILLSVFGLLLSGVAIYFIDKIYQKKVHFEILEVIKKD